MMHACPETWLSWSDLSSAAVKIIVRRTKISPGWLFVSFQMGRRHLDVVEATVAPMIKVQPYNHLSPQSLCADLTSWYGAIRVVISSFYLKFFFFPVLVCLLTDENGPKISAPTLRLGGVIKALRLGPSLAAAGVQHHAAPFDPVSLQGWGGGGGAGARRRPAASTAILLQTPKIEPSWLYLSGGGGGG